MKCTFFGHKDVSDSIAQSLITILTDQIENHSADTFYVGNNGNFDRVVKNILKQLKLIYPHINYYVVLAYMPGKKQAQEDLSDTIYPEGLEFVPMKYAIDKRNRWMLEKADCVITYVTHNFGGAAKFKAIAERKGKMIINIAN